MNGQRSTTESLEKQCGDGILLDRASRVIDGQVFRKNKKQYIFDTVVITPWLKCVRSKLF